MFTTEEKECHSFNFAVQPYTGKGSILTVLKKQKGKLLINQQTIYNSRFNYLESYFEKIGVKAIIYEFEYNDKEYIEDFSNYYCRSFKDYPKKCVRLHFFTIDITYSAFEIFIKTYVPDKKDPKKGNPYYDFYAGFAVLRPIPLTLFGRTCLKTYIEEKEDGGKRCYPTTRDYKTHLFGIEFSVKSIAFQEQDNAVSACATTALWVAFHGTARLFEHLIPTPYEITLNASKYMMPNNRKQIPYSEGLKPYEMTCAIIQQGLQSFETQPGDTNYCKAKIYAYLKCGIPVITGMKLYEKTSDKDWNNEDLESAEIKGRHAVTAVGYDYYPNRLLELCKDEKNLCLVSSSMQQIYVHDDQIGAFAKMIFEQDENAKYVDLESSWANFNDDYKDKDMRFRINVLMFPLYHKIRIRFDKIYSIINDFSSKALSPRPFRIIWDIYLTTVCDFKQEIRQYDDELFEKDIKLKILTNNYPRYIWVADARIVNNEDILTDDNNQLRKPDFALYFDATDMDNSDIFLFALHFDSNSYYFLRKLIEKSIEEFPNGDSPFISYKNRAYPYQMKRIIHHYMDIIEEDNSSLSDFSCSKIFYRKRDTNIDEALKNKTSEELRELISKLTKN
jgi:hypothetical protein